MKVVALTGDGPRHAYIAAVLARAGLLAGHVVQTREPALPEPPRGIGPELTALFVRHFSDRQRIEQGFFASFVEPHPGTAVVQVSRHEISGPKTWELIARVAPDLVISYGVARLDESTLARMPEARWNVHGGLSPAYRGVATHFWPSYMLEPQMTGMTLHELTERLDGGPIVHQSVGPLVAGDGIHELACRTVERFGSELVRVIELFAAGRLTAPRPQESAGKLWLGRDFRPEHLRLIYQTYQNRIVNAYLGGELLPREPKLLRQL